MSRAGFVPTRRELDLPSQESLAHRRASLATRRNRAAHLRRRVAYRDQSTVYGETSSVHRETNTVPGATNLVHGDRGFAQAVWNPVCARTSPLRLPERPVHARAGRVRSIVCLMSAVKRSTHDGSAPRRPGGLPSVATRRSPPPYRLWRASCCARRKRETRLSSLLRFSLRLRAAKSFAARRPGGGSARSAEGGRSPQRNRPLRHSSGASPTNRRR
jgi:hypothetical protein